jgi:glutamate/tyrosine decarboxylase-like PLP-dependent enzyme
MADHDVTSAWFAGPKAENASWFAERLRQVVEDYYAWRRNYFPEDGVVVDSALRRHSEGFTDAFEDRLLELLARLKADVPFHSPRYAAHMLAEQTLPGIAGYFAAMLYNPNNVASEVAPVTVKLELEAGRLLSRMIGYGEDAWAHLCSGGTTANIEALWVARSVRYLPFAVRDARRAAGLPDRRSPADLLALPPLAALEDHADLWRSAAALPPARRDAARRAFTSSPFNTAERGLAAVAAELKAQPVLVIPESHHYCFEKALDLLGLGRQALAAVRVDRNFRMDVHHLDKTLRDADRQGRHVLAVVAVVGSTEEGSVDPLDLIHRLRTSREKAGLPSFWLHADGAYGAYLRAITVPERAGLGGPTATVRIGNAPCELPLTLPEHGECAALEHLPCCDSVTIDPHKLGYIPYPAGALCFRSNLVKPLIRQAAPYLEDAPLDVDAERRSDAVGLYVLEGSKPGAAAAAVWLSHSLIPLDNTGHGRLMRENIRNACELHALLERMPDLAGPTPVRAVCLCPPGSNILCYAFRPAGRDAPLDEVNRLNRAVFDRFTAAPGRRTLDQSFFVSRTSLSIRQYSLETVGDFLDRLGVDAADYERHGVFLLRSVLMNPWYAHAKRRGRYFLSELAAELYRAAAESLEAPAPRAQPRPHRQEARPRRRS